ncbi:soluble starch synthase III-1 [Dorcoceras hygrometricum]|uniref:Soluble starch synthase III-1 n=1 Tax=Dorcoceras hygrometricum TaxID=472368 RepID=A0A2Z7CHR7_9LAMI|nr:soluble starch synthase III-1 [Dorcoceras hygrometricum]
MNQLVQVWKSLLDKKKKIQDISTADESVSSRKDISTSPFKKKKIQVISTADESGIEKLAEESYSKKKIQQTKLQCPVARFPGAKNRSSKVQQSLCYIQQRSSWRFTKDECQLLSSIQMVKATRSLQKKRTQVLFPCRYFTEERCTKMERRQDSHLKR